MFTLIVSVYTYCLCLHLLFVYNLYYIYCNCCSVGVVTAIPLSVLVDFIIHKKTSGYQVYIGMLLIVIGFIGFCVSEIVASKREHNEKVLPCYCYDVL